MKLSKNPKPTNGIAEARNNILRADELGAVKLVLFDNKEWAIRTFLKDFLRGMIRAVKKMNICYAISTVCMASDYCKECRTTESMFSHLPSVTH